MASALNRRMLEESNAKALGSGVQFIKTGPPLSVAWYARNGLGLVTGAGAPLPTGDGTTGGDKPDEGGLGGSCCIPMFCRSIRPSTKVAPTISKNDVNITIIRCSINIKEAPKKND